jgi:glycosyltransferase involved in cell wall biosynthesis
MDKKVIKIIRIINRFNLGGPTYNVSLLSKYLPEPYETLLIGGKEESHEASSLFIPESMGLKPIQVKSLSRKISPVDDLRAFFEIYTIIKKHKPHIVHTHAAKAGFIGRLAAKLCGVPVIVHTYHGHVFRNYFSPFKTRVIIFTERLLARLSDAIIAISPEQHHDLTYVFKICPAEKCHIVHLGFDLGKFTRIDKSEREKFRRKYLIKDDEIAIGIIGRLAPIKNHQLFLENIAELKKENLRIKALIVGDGELKENLTNVCKEKGLFCQFNEPETSDYDVCFTGWIKEMEKCLPGLDIVCLTSKNEGTPVSLIEAQAAGKIIVSTNVGGVKDIKFSDYFFLTEKEDFSDFKNKLQQAILLQGSVNKELLIESSNRIIREYHYERLVSDIKKLYDNLIRIKKII